MKSPACTQCRWGTGTTKDRESDTDAAKEARARMAAMMAEREKQDEMWSAKPSDAGGAQLVQAKGATFYATSDSRSGTSDSRSGTSDSSSK